MKITFAPIRSDADLALSLAGDVLTINGAPLDLSAIPAGATLPASAVDSDWIAGPISRDEAGQISLTILLPHAHGAPHARRYPLPIIVTADGPIGLPDNTPEDPHAD